MKEKNTTFRFIITCAVLATYQSKIALCHGPKMGRSIIAGGGGGVNNNNNNNNNNNKMMMMKKKKKMKKKMEKYKKKKKKKKKKLVPMLRQNLIPVSSK
jgi:predicted flavoprotein YhiN